MDGERVLYEPHGLKVEGKPPALFLADARFAERFLEFFAANIRSRNTRRAYYTAVCSFSDWCEERELFDLAKVKPLHVAAYVEGLLSPHSKPTVKQHLAALRMLFDWLVVGHVMDGNPAHSVRGPKHLVKKGKTRIILQELDRCTDFMNCKTYCELVTGLIRCHKKGKWFAVDFC